MMLRESVQQTGETFELTALSGADAGDDTGHGTVPHHDLLLDFAEAVTLRDDRQMTALRPRMIATLGIDGYLDACGVIAGFHGFTRIADSAGVKLDERYLADAEAVKDQTGVREFSPMAGEPI